MELQDYADTWQKLLSAKAGSVTDADLEKFRELAAYQLGRINYWSNEANKQVDQVLWWADLVNEWKGSYELMKSLVDAYEQSPPITDAKRKPMRGRPRKHDAKIFLEMVDGYKAKYGTAYRAKYGRKMSDRAALTEYFRSALKEHGLRASLADSHDYKRRLKTVLNLVADARSEIRRIERIEKLTSKNPEN